MMNIGVRENNKMIGVLLKMIMRGIRDNKGYKIDEYLDIKIYLCEKHLLSKLVLACEDEIVSTTETSLVDKKVTCEKKNCPIHMVLLVIISLLQLVANSVSCYN